MAEDIRILRERQDIEREIAELKKKGKNLTDEELALFSKLEARKKSLIKAEQLALKEQQKNQSQSYTLQSKLSSLQDEIGQRVKRNGRYVFELAHGFRMAQSNMAPMISGGIVLKGSLGDIGNLMDNLGESVQKSSDYLEGTNDGVNRLLEGLAEAENQRTIDIGISPKEFEDLQKAAQGYFTAASGVDYKVDPNVQEDAKRRLEQLNTSMSALNSKGESVFTTISDRMSEAVDRLGTGLGNVAGLQADNIGLAQQMAMNYDKVGTEGFSSSVDRAEELADQTRRQAKITRSEVIPDMQKKIKFMMQEASILPKESKERKAIMKVIENTQVHMEDLVEATEEAEATAKRNVAQAHQMRIANSAVASGAELILAPFTKLNSMLESAPGGKYFSALFDTEGKLSEFTDTVNKNLLGAVTPDQARIVKLHDKMGNVIGERYQDISTGKFIGKDDEKVMTIGSGDMQLENIMKGAREQVEGITKAMPQVVTSLKIATKAAFGFAKAALANPYIAIAAAVALVGVALLKAFNYAEEMRKEFGTTREEAFELQRAVDTTTMNFKMMGVSADDVKTLATGIADSMGGVRNVTEENLNSMANLVGTFGMGADKLAPTITAMKALGADSTQAAAAQLEQVGNMAQLEGVAPAKVFEDMTADMETFSKFGKEGGMNLAKASITARKLGVNMATIASSADALLDFESSIQAQMEAQMLTGRSINTDKARELALAGDLDGQAREIAKQVGSQAQFDAMNVVQREAMAKAFGVNVQDLASMVANQEELNSLTAEERAQREASQKRSEKINEGMKSMGSELGELFNQAMEPLKQLMVALGPTLGVILKALGIALKTSFMPLIFAFKILNPIIKLIGFLLTMVINIGDAIRSGLMAAFNAVKPAVATIAKVLGVIIFPKIALMVGLVKLIMNNFDAIKNTLLSVGGFILRLLVSPFVNLFNMIKMIGTALFDFFMSPIRMVKDAIMGLLPNWALSLLGFDEGGGEASVAPTSSLSGAPTSAAMSGTVQATSMTIQGGQVTELKSITKEIKKGNVVSEQIASSTGTSASQTRKLNSSIASG